VQRDQRIYASAEQLSSIWTPMSDSTALYFYRGAIQGKEHLQPTIIIQCLNLNTWDSIPFVSHYEKAQWDSMHFDFICHLYPQITYKLLS
jgi:hypothetical protein